MTAEIRTPIKVFLKREGAHEYWTLNQRWTTNRDEAQEFESVPEAAQRALLLDLEDVRVAILDPGLNRELLLPASLE